MPHLYPLTKEKFMELHREAWVNGWTYGPGFDELYEDYLVNWIYFVDYLDFMIKLKNIKRYSIKFYNIWVETSPISTWVTIGEVLISVKVRRIRVSRQ